MRLRKNLKMLGLALGMAAAAGAAVKVKANYPNHGPTVTLTAVVTDTSGGTMSYHWRSTDGSIKDANSTTTTWTLPSGPGLHFAYLLASNGNGGYTERRVAVNTDTIGLPVQQGAARNNLSAPPAPAQVGNYYRSTIAWSASTTASTQGPFPSFVNAPDALVQLQDTTTNERYPQTGPARTDITGRFSIAFPSASDGFNVNCSVDGGKTFSPCRTSSLHVGPGQATTDYLSTRMLSACPATRPSRGACSLSTGTPAARTTSSSACTPRPARPCGTSTAGPWASRHG